LGLRVVTYDLHSIVRRTMRSTIIAGSSLDYDAKLIFKVKLVTSDDPGAPDSIERHQ
jgi:hypothetical protein